MSTTHAHRGARHTQRADNLSPSEATEDDDNSLDYEAEKMINEAYSKLRLGTSRREEVDRKLHALHQQKLQQMANSKNECTFRPKINRASSVSEPMYDIPVEERLRRDAEMREARRQAAVDAKAHSKEASYSFKPQINHNSRRTASEMNPSRIPVEDRLMHYAEATEESRYMLAEQRRRQEDENMKQFFNPKIKDWGVDRDKDFFARLEESEIKKKIAMEEQREEMSSAHSFKPQLSRISEAYVEGRRQLGWDNSRNRTDALYHEAKIRQQTQADRQAEIEAMESDPLMYKPSTSRLNDEILKTSKLKDLYGPTSFVERQQVFHELAKQHAQQLKRDVENDERRSGIKAKPSLHNTSQSTGGCNQEYDDDEDDKLDEAAIQDQVDRLYTQPRETSKTLKKVLAEKEINTKCPFKPTLAPATEEYWRVLAERNSGKGDIFERLAAAPVKRIDQQQQQQGLNDSISVATDDEKKRRRISQGQVDEFYRKQLSGLQRKEQMLKKQKLLQEMEGQKDCTFHPDIQVRSTPTRRRGSSAPPPPSPHSRHNTSVCSTTSTVKEVMGVSSFMQRQESARRRRQEQEERVSQLGKGKQCNGPNYTVVTPFKLSNRSASAGSGLPNHRVTSNTQASEAGTQSTLLRKSIYRPQYSSSQQQRKAQHHQDATSMGHAYPYADPSRFTAAATTPRPTTTTISSGHHSPPRYGDIDASANISTMGYATNSRPHPRDATANTSVNPNLGNMETLSYNRDSAPVRRATVRVSPSLESNGGDTKKAQQYVDATPQSATLLQAAMKRYLSAGVKKSLKTTTM